MKKRASFTAARYEQMKKEAETINAKLAKIAKLYSEIEEMTKENKWMHYTGEEYSNQVTQVIDPDDSDNGEKWEEFHNVKETISAYDVQRLVERAIYNREA